MSVVLDKIMRAAKHAMLSSNPVYRFEKMRLARKRGHLNLPSYEEARARLLGLRPPLDITPPKAHSLWPEVPKYDISVIVPCYNAAPFVEQSIHSVLCQKCAASFEVIAIDDGSTDGTPFILDSMAEGDERVSVVHQDNKGFSGARNVGISRIQGSSIVFLDSDDALAPGALQALYDKLKSSGADYVTGRYTYIDERGYRLPLAARRPAGVPWGRIYNREVWRRLEFPENVWFEDTVHAYMVRPCFSEAVVDRAVYYYRKQSGSITATSRNSKRSVDTYFVTEAMLSWRNAFGLAFDQATYDQTLYQLGPLLISRTIALDEEELACCFVCAQALLTSAGEDVASTSHCAEKWLDLDSSLRCGDFELWRAASRSI